MRASSLQISTIKPMKEIERFLLQLVDRTENGKPVVPTSEEQERFKTYFSSLIGKTQGEVYPPEAAMRESTVRGETVRKICTRKDLFMDEVLVAIKQVKEQLKGEIVEKVEIRFAGSVVGEENVWSDHIFFAVRWC